MKRSEFVKDQIEAIIGQEGLGPAASGVLAHRAARAAERAGVTWDPEEEPPSKPLPVWGTVRVRTGLPSNAQEVPAPDRGEFPLLRRADEVNLIGEMDGQVWAKEFCRLADELGHNLDEGWMISWFVNAIMTGYDAGSRLKRDTRVNEPREHVTDGSPCWCNPEVESFEQQREVQVLATDMSRHLGVLGRQLAEHNNRLIELTERIDELERKSRDHAVVLAGYGDILKELKPKLP